MKIEVTRQVTLDGRTYAQGKYSVVANNVVAGAGEVNERYVAPLKANFPNCVKDVVKKKPVKRATKAKRSTASL